VSNFRQHTHNAKFRHAQAKRAQRERKIVFFIQLITYFAFSAGIIDHSIGNQTKRALTRLSIK
jgi:hypothetical protein